MILWKFFWILKLNLLFFYLCCCFFRISTWFHIFIDAVSFKIHFDSHIFVYCLLQMSVNLGSSLWCPQFFKYIYIYARLIFPFVFLFVFSFVFCLVVFSCIFSGFFGRIEDTIDCFWDSLTCNLIDFLQHLTSEGLLIEWKSQT